MSRSTAALLHSWIEAFKGRDPVALAALYSDGCVLESPSFGTVAGRAGVEAPEADILLRHIEDARAVIDGAAFRLGAELHAAHGPAHGRGARCVERDLIDRALRDDVAPLVLG